MTRKTIAEHMKDILFENKQRWSLDGQMSIWFGDIEQIHECAKRAGMYEKAKVQHGTHPLNIIHKVLNGLERSDLFEKRYMKWENKNVRRFVLKEEN